MTNTHVQETSKYSDVARLKTTSLMHSGPGLKYKFVDYSVKETLNSCAHAHSTCHEYHYSCIAGNGNGVRGSVVFWCSKICEQCQQASYFFMLGKLYDHWRRRA